MHGLLHCISLHCHAPRRSRQQRYLTITIIQIVHAVDSVANLYVGVSRDLQQIVIGLTMFSTSCSVFAP